MKYHIMPVTAFSQNCSLVWCEQTGEAALVDPGGEAQRLRQEVAPLGVTVKEIWLMHGHLDHVGAASELAAFYRVPIVGPIATMNRCWRVCRGSAKCLAWKAFRP